ncbi:MAG: hypothetical protein DRH50_15405 [Deltaproteobacteria bacterium]|nr:MAG: hypothetical protein DRH50_15405 [Deltaproteobacteria bacterium]
MHILQLRLHLRVGSICRVERGYNQFIYFSSCFILFPGKSFTDKVPYQTGAKDSQSADVSP